MPEKLRQIVMDFETASQLLELFEEGYEKDKEVSYNPDGPDHLKIYYLVKYSEDEVLEKALVSPEKLKDVVIDSVSVPIDKHTDRKEGEETPYQQYMKKGYHEGHKTSSAVVMELTEKTSGDYLVDFVMKFSKEHDLNEKLVVRVLVDAYKVGLPAQEVEFIDLPPSPVREQYTDQDMETVTVTVTDEQVAETRVEDVTPIEDLETGVPPADEKPPLVFKKATGEPVKIVAEYDVEALGCATCHMDDTCRAKAIHYMTVEREGLHMCPLHPDYDKTKAEDKKPEAEAPAEKPETVIDEEKLGCPSCKQGCDAETKLAKWERMEKNDDFGCREWVFKK